MQPGRTVLAANQLGLEVQVAAVELRVDRIDREPAGRRPQDHGNLAQPHAKDIERIDLDSDFAFE